MSVPDWRRGDHSRKYKSRHEAGYDYKWVKLRLVALKRDGYLCQACKPWPRPAKDVDHIKPKAEGGEDRLDNLQSLCRECHTAKTTKENRSRGLPEYGADGWPTDGHARSYDEREAASTRRGWGKD